MCCIVFALSRALVDYNRTMKPALLAVRSVAVEFARRLYKPVFIIVVIASVVLLAVSIWLVTINAWWAILLVVVSLWVIIATIALVVAWVIMRVVAPSQNKSQRKLTKGFVDKLQNIAEAAGTPKFILLFQVFRDVISPRQNGFIESISSDTLSLKKDFVEIKKSFEQ